MKKIKFRAFLLIIFMIMALFLCFNCNPPLSSSGGSGSGNKGGSEDEDETLPTPQGIFQWAKRLGGTDSDEGYSITIDTSNNIIVTGRVYENADLNSDGIISPGQPEMTTGTNGNYDIFISYFNSSGTFQWSKRLGGTSGDNGYSITTDTSNNIIITGFVVGNADLNGDGVISPSMPETATGTYGNYDVFISCFNSSGTFQWSKRLGGISNDIGYSITTNTSNNVLITGRVFGNADLNGDGIISPSMPETATGTYGSGDVFISCFNSSGTAQWVMRLGGTSDDVGYDIATDTSNNIIITGYVNGNADLNADGDSADGGAESSTGYGSGDVFISYFNSSGTFQWAKRLGGTSADVGYNITTDTSNNVIVTGYVNGNADLNGDGDSTDGGAESSTGYGSNDIFISKFTK